MSGWGIRRLAAHERELWIAALVLYGLGDAATTLLGLSVAEIAEIGPVAGPLMAEHGRAALLAIKAVTFCLFVGVWAIVPRPTRVAVPLAAALVGAVVTGWNLATIAAALA